jgi:hypothetical protein
VPEQHCDDIAQVDSPMHACPGGGWQRRVGAWPGSGAHFVPAQQSSSRSQTSPMAPHVAGWHREAPVASGAHTPEQQSAFAPQRSHCGRQPPSGAHRFTPSPVATQRREQHEFASLHTSPTCSAQPLLSFIVHAATLAQRVAPLTSATQRPVQQSPGTLQISPSTRHACRSAQRSTSPSSTQDLPQQSLSSAHVSPAGLQPGPAALHWPALHTFVQHSRGMLQGAPTEPHVPTGAQPAAVHASEQHAPARSQPPPAPMQPVVGRHVVSSRVSTAQ